MVYFRYLWSLFRHKWFVFLECSRLGMPIVGLAHDWSKFLPDEFLPYAVYFWGDGGQEAFDVAWLKHQNRNPHHWQWWILVNDEDDDKVLDMPGRYRKEMLADWRGAGRSYGNSDTTGWYLKNNGKMQLHDDTRAWIEEQLL